MKIVIQNIKNFLRWDLAGKYLQGALSKNTVL